MWLKAHALGLPFFPTLMFLYCLLVCGAWRAGRVGYVWARLRADVLRWRQYKREELTILGRAYAPIRATVGTPDDRVPQYE